MNKDGGALNDEGFVSGKISKLVNDNIDDLFETPAPIEADKELPRVMTGLILYGAGRSLQREDVIGPEEAETRLLAWRDKQIVANVKRELSNIVDPGDGTVYSYTRIGTNAIKRLKELTKEEGAKDEKS